MSRQVVILGDPQGRYVQRLLNSAPAGILPKVAEYSSIETRLWGPVSNSNERISLGGVSLNDGDIVLVRSMSRGSLESIVFRMDALAAMERQGILVYNPARSLEFAIDKYLSLSILAANGFPTPATHVAECCDQAVRAFESLGGDVVVKPLFGSEGRGLIRISDIDHAVRVFRSLESLGGLIYQQAFIDHGGRDYRVLIIGHREWVIEREQDNDWRTNVSRGGRCQRASLPPLVLDMARRAAERLGLFYAGIDLVQDPLTQEFLVLEANGVPGWQGVASAFDQEDIEQEIWGDVMRRANA
ncbi:MAG: RimK family alpha-L-glutamate ligase [Planctomycetaceae bacterium]|nr:RimK family alpha-L-glutamate ligase [Planctomycetaceae bacterium]